MTTRMQAPRGGRSEAATRWEITVPGWHPARLNELLGRNRFVIQRLKKRDRKMVGICAAVLRVPFATGKRRVTLKITLGPRQRAGDPDAYWKSLLDGCVHLGLLKNDNRQWVELAPVEFERGESKATTIILEDIDACD